VSVQAYARGHRAFRLGCLDLGQQFSNLVNERLDLALQHLERLSVDDFAKRRQDALNRSQSECVKGDKHLVHVRNGLVQKEENWDVDRQTTLVYPAHPFHGVDQRR